MTRPLRFCMLTTFYPPYSFGGDGIQVERLATALASRGHDVTVIHAPDAHRTPAHRRLAAPANGVVRRIPIDSRAGGIGPLATYLTGRRLLGRRRLVRALAEGFDVLHFHNPSLLGGAEVLQLGSGIKLYTAHEQWLVCPTHVLWKYQRRICEAPTCWRCSLTYGRPPQLWRSGRLLQRSVGQLDALIAPSRTSARLHERFAPLVRIEQIPHFVPEPSRPHLVPVPRQRPYFLYVGRLESIKGVDSLLRVFARRDREDLLIAGEGTHEGSLRRQAAGSPNVHFLGWQQPESLDRLYRGARGVVIPTLGHEAFGLVLVESLAHGTPVVARDFGALAELLEESGGGLGFRTEAELDEALDRLASDDLRRKLGARGRAAHQARWSAAAHLDAYLGLIARVAGERGDLELAEAAEAARPPVTTAP